VSTRAVAPAAALFVAALGLSLTGCASRAALVIHAASPELRQELAVLAERYTRTAGLQVVPAEAPVAGAADIEIGWAFPVERAAQAAQAAQASPGAPTARPLSDQTLRRSGYGTALAFERWARGDGGWRALPLLWDAWGVAGPAGSPRGAGAARTFTWKDRDLLVRTGAGVVAPLGEPGVRQAWYWFSSGALPGDGTVQSILAGGPPRSSEPASGYFKSFAASGRDPLLSPDHGNTRLSAPDVENFARNGGADRLLGSYRSLRRISAVGAASTIPREFTAIVYGAPEGYAMPVSVLVGRVTGSGAAAERAWQFLLWLASTENQKALSNASGYMAANFAAPNLDPDAAEARQAAVKAARVVFVDPEPRADSAAASWDSLLERVLARPADWQHAVTEK